MPTVDLDYKAIRKRVEAELKREKLTMRGVFFVVNLLMFLIFSVMGWGMFTANQAGIPPETSELIGGGMVMLTVAAGMGVLFQFISLVVETKAGEAKMRERIVGRVMGDELLRLGAEDEDAPEEKEKRMMRLSDDGELAEIIDDPMLSDEEIQAVSSRRR
jgi:hypothetical protein